MKIKKRCILCRKPDPEIYVRWGPYVLLHEKCLSPFFKANQALKNQDELTIIPVDEADFDRERFSYPPKKVGGKYMYQVGCAKCGHEELTYEEEGSLEAWSCPKC